MGFEHGLSFEPALNSSTLQHLLSCLKSPSTWLLIQAEQKEESHLLSYAYGVGTPLIWEEDFLVDLSDQKIYLLIHTATGEQEQAVLAWLQRCLHSSGLFKAELQEL